MSPEIRDLFEGMSYSFTAADGTPYECVVEDGESVMYEMVETQDCSMSRKVDCTPVYGGYTRFTGGSVCNWFTHDQLEEARENDEVVYLDGRDEYWSRDACEWCEEDDQYYHSEEVIYVCGEYYRSDSDAIRTDHRGDYFLSGDYDYCFVESEGEFYHESECHWHEESNEYHAGEESDCEECCGSDDCRINRYHCSPSPALFRGVSPYLVGFEIEKKSIDGMDSVGEGITPYPLFSGWECDASCGVEGITHAYDPLDPVTTAKFRQDLLDSEDYVNEQCDKSCGGHINISSSHHTPRELIVAFRNYAPLWYAVYRNRLNNNYCGTDKKIEHGTAKYSPVRTKDFGIEIRLPNRVRNATQLQRRFEWVGLTCRAINDCQPFHTYVRECRTLLLEGAFHGDRAKYAMILRLARKFRIWMLDGIAHESIQQWT